MIWLLAGAVLLLNVIAWIANYVRRKLSAEVIGDVVLKVRADVFDATVRHDMSFYDEHPSGKIVSRVTSDTQDFSNVVTLTMDFISQVLLIAILTAWLAAINIWLTLLLLAITPFAIFVALSFRRIARAVTRHRAASTPSSTRRFRNPSAASSSPRASARSRPSTRRLRTTTGSRTASASSAT
jgi:ABC-type multidrug transport system fused ATPase/permease subunit